MKKEYDDVSARDLFELLPQQTMIIKRPDGWIEIFAIPDEDNNYQYSNKSHTLELALRRILRKIKCGAKIGTGFSKEGWV